MGFEREPQRAVVVHHVLGQRHGRERDLRLAPRLRGVRMLEQRQRDLLGQAAHLPEGLAPVEAERAERIGACQLLDPGAADTAAAPQILHAGIGALAPRGNLIGIGFAEAVDLSQA